MWSSIKRCHLSNYIHKGKTKLSQLSPVVLIRRHPFGLSALWVTILLPFPLSASKEEGRRSSRHLKYTNKQKQTCWHTLFSGSWDFPSQSRREHGKTRAVEEYILYIRAKENPWISVCCCKFSTFLDHHARAHRQAVSKHTYSSACTHRHGRTHTQSSCQSFSRACLDTQNEQSLSQTKKTTT